MNPIPQSRCPYCRATLDDVFGVYDDKDKQPLPGNVSLCIMCGNWMVFGPNLKLIKPSIGLLADIKRNRRCQIAYHAVMKMLRNRARKN